MRKTLLALALASAGLGFAPAAHSLVPCEGADIECHKTCTLGNIKNLGQVQC